MDTLHFDFTQAASRTAILEQMGANMSAMARHKMDRVVNELDIPDEHFHDLAAINRLIDELDIEE